mgnify:FL=1|tara:strand:+ start:777 stop:1790 length:1014 start_codon:yes stop_codon:yes gene_type:complete
MNAVDKEIEMLQAEKKNKPTSSYEVEVTSDDIIETSPENEVEFKEEKKTFEVEEDSSQGEDPVVENISKSEEVVEEKKEEDGKGKYSKSIQKRFDEYAYQLGESKRREEEAITIAQAIKSERDKVKATLEQLNKGYVDEMGGRVTGSLTAAKAKLKKAMEDADYEAVADSQLEIGKLSTDQARYEDLKGRVERQQNAPKQQEIEIPQPQPQQPVKDPKAESWAAGNEWFGSDKVMTNVAYAIHEELVNQGVDPRTDYYYTEIDKRMRDNLPHKFEQVSPQEESVTQQPVQTVAGARRNRGTGRNIVKLSSSEAAIAKRLGLSNEQYASEKLKLQRGN